MKKHSFSTFVLPEEIEAFSRRDFLQTGVSLAGYVSLPALLAGTPASAETLFTVERRLVWINMSGGWDILEVMDPKASSTSGITIPYGWGDCNDLAGSSRGEKMGRWLPGIASRGADVILVRGMSMGTTSHQAGSVYMDTGILSNTGTVNAASIPAVVASESQATIPVIQLNGGTMPQTDRGLLKPTSVVRAENLELYRALYPTNDDQTARRLRLLDYLKDSITRVKDTAGTNDRLKAVESAETKIRKQIEDRLSAKLALTAEDKKPFARTLAAGQTMGPDMSNTFALAAKLISNNLVSCITLGMGGFDTHAGQDARLKPVLESFDFYLSAFIDQLKAQGAFDNTLIVCYSDFGRTPKINGSNGRDHWPVGGALLIGGGLAGGRTVGDTDDNLMPVTTNLDSGLADPSGTPLNPTHLGGSVLKLTLGANYMQYRSYLTAINALTRLKT